MTDGVAALKAGFLGAPVTPTPSPPSAVRWLRVGVEHGAPASPLGSPSCPGPLHARLVVAGLTILLLSSRFLKKRVPHPQIARVLEVFVTGSQ